MKIINKNKNMRVLAVDEFELKGLLCDETQLVDKQTNEIKARARTSNNIFIKEILI